MRKISLKYGTGSVTFRVPEASIAGVWGASGPCSTAGDPEIRSAEVLSRGLHELKSSGFREAVRGRRLGLLVADGTRAWYPEEILPPLAALVSEAAALDVFLCTGTHRPDTRENIDLARRVRAALEGFSPVWEVLVHDALEDEHRFHGKTRRGTRVEVWARADPCEVFLVLSDMKHHYFAGYSNPVKYVIPGIASTETARGNHSLALEREALCGRHPWHPDPGRRSNPLAEDMLEAYEMFLGGRPHFALATHSAGDELCWAGGGESGEAARRCMRVVDERAGINLQPSRYLVVSAGGVPHDESFYTVQRALELSRAAVLDGGEVLFLARCHNGIGSDVARRNFFEPLKRPLASIRAVRRADYRLYSHKPVKLARLLERLGALHLYSDLDPGEVRAIHMLPTAAPQALLDGWVRTLGPGEAVGFLDDASSLAILPR